MGRATHSVHQSRVRGRRGEGEQILRQEEEERRLREEEERRRREEEEGRRRRRPSNESSVRLSSSVKALLTVLTLLYRSQSRAGWRARAQSRDRRRCAN